jgi:hypothetical protein
MIMYSTRPSATASFWPKSLAYFGAVGGSRVAINFTA